MEFLISKKQLSILLEEQSKSKFSDYMNQMYSFLSDMVNKVNKKYKINIKLLLTWGASMAGLLLPLDNFIRNNNLEISDEQRYLILVGVAAVLLYESRKTTRVILEKIQELGLSETFSQTLSKAKSLKKSFSKFLQSSNIIIENLTDIISYAFLIPIITDIQSIIQKTSNFEDSCELIVKRVVASGVVLISSEILSELIKKVAAKFK